MRHFGRIAMVLYMYNYTSAKENHNNFIKTTKTFANIKKSRTFASFLKNDQKNNGSVAQLVEQQTLNLWVVGSTPTRFTKRDESLGEMSEWSNEPVLKTGVLVRVPGVRIPLSPLKLV